ncbi:MAG: riboflavin synthase [Gaiellales bacterium]|nr:riboflavin synthase [Gaiellales bacterium]
MFTGIVEELGEVVELDVTDAGARLAVQASKLAPLARIGDSISISGACLTVVSIDNGVLRFEAVPETLSRTALGTLAVGDPVNLEDALRAGEPFGGHMVQGHVDGVGTVAAIEPEGDGYRITIRTPRALLRYLAEKGSIGVAGISLTVAALRDDGFEVAVIPHTWNSTTVSRWKVGDPVNLEVDVIAKYVERLLP